jgi:predicted alpha/beta superfamily hydrolase
LHWSTEEKKSSHVSRIEQSHDPSCIGGGPQFLRSLVEEVNLGIEALYRAHPTDRTLIGVSLSGLFGLYVLFHRPKAFARYLLVRPAIHLHDRR